jgi:integral membrane protein (TIGR01906 family)
MKKFKLTDILIGFVFTLLFISIGVIAAVNFRFIYYRDIDRLNISQTSGLEKEVIINNYDTLIRYNSPFYKGNLELPNLPSSPGGLQHFAEVKTIFIAFYYIAAISMVISLLIIFYKHRKKENSYLLVSSITVLVIPFIAVLGSMINFDAIFILFHKIFFRNDLWIFDPAKDPVITILPDTFFLHSLLVIIAFVLLGSILLLLSYFWTNSKIQYRRRRTVHYR